MKSKETDTILVVTPQPWPVASSSRASAHNDSGGKNEPLNKSADLLFVYSTACLYSPDREKASWKVIFNCGRSGLKGYVRRCDECLVHPRFEGLVNSANNLKLLLTQEYARFEISL